MVVASSTLPTLYVWRLQWHSPYSEPPDGKPRIRAEMATHDRRAPEAIVALASPGDGYALTFQHLPPPHRSMTSEAKARLRQKRLVRRMQRRYPLFVEQFAAEKIAARPDYYLEGVSDGDAERERVLATERDYYELMLANVSRLFVYDQAIRD